MKIKDYLKKHKIEFKEFKHKPLYTCEQAEKCRTGINGTHSKNLFLKNKKSKRFYLVVLPSNKNLDFKLLGEKLNEKLKFANEGDLKSKLDLIPGSVSPFGLINNVEKDVILVLDKEVFNSEFVSFHPNINTETLELTNKNFHRYLDSLKNEKEVIEI
jgi:Ala-tRNA(Pro) deacylase